MKQPDRTTTHAGIVITAVHNWLLCEWGAAWHGNGATFFAPGFASSDRAFEHARKVIDGQYEPIAKGTN